MQVFGEHYFNTFSNTVRYDTLRTLLSIAASMDLTLTSLDIKTAYLNGYIEPGVKLYLRFPRGWKFTKNGDSWDYEYTGDFQKTRGKPEQAFRLVKAMYGLKQGGAVWEEELRNFLLSLGAVQSTVDPCLWRYSESGKMILFVVYVETTSSWHALASTSAMHSSSSLVTSSHCATTGRSPGSSVRRSRKTYEQVPSSFTNSDTRVVPCTDEISNVTPLAER